MPLYSVLLYKVLGPLSTLAAKWGGKINNWRFYGSVVKFKINYNVKLSSSILSGVPPLLAWIWTHALSANDLIFNHIKHDLEKSLEDSIANVTISTLKFSIVWIILVTGNLDSLRFNSFQRFLFYWIVSDPFFLPNFAFLSLLEIFFLLHYIQAVVRWRS